MKASSNLLGRLASRVTTVLVEPPWFIGCKKRNQNEKRNLKGLSV
jgi:hypothetical protein